MLRRHAIGLAAAGPVLVGKTLVKLGLKTPPEAWRKLLGVGLRDEPSKFALSAFGLRVAAAELPARLHDFLRTEPEAACALTHSRRFCARHGFDTIDLVVQHFDMAGVLTGMTVLADPARPAGLDESARAAVHTAVVRSYQATARIPERRRPAELAAGAARGLGPAAVAYLGRLLKAACLTTEPVDTLRRFEPPAVADRRGLGHNAYTFAARTDGGGTADIWGVAHHVAADGVPFQELFTRLERAWGTDPVAFPAPGTVFGPRRAFHPGEREVFESLSFHDFAPLLRLRKRVNAELGPALGQDVPVGALLVWVLAREPEFAGAKFASTVDVAATPTRERAVDLVPRRPADFGDDLAAFARSYLDGIAASRERRSPVQQAGADLSHLPPRLFRALLEASPAQLAETFGEIGLSVIRDAKVFIAPLSDVAYPGGFFAVGGVGLPAVGGGTVGAVTVKGTRDQAGTYPAALTRALGRCAG
ncbi:MAG TPA: hypothetical protein VH092_16405 [Urbifossiella sp.]|jgi:hypothetical protein|nr:hypothetical protein [Urbifossiella sp.]